MAGAEAREEQVVLMPPEWDDETPHPGDMRDHNGVVIRCPHPYPILPDWVIHAHTRTHTHTHTHTHIPLSYSLTLSPTRIHAYTPLPPPAR